jgi:predicted outer membrane repeat protein
MTIKESFFTFLSALFITALMLAAIPAKSAFAFAPEIDVQRLATTSIDDDSSDSLGEQNWGIVTVEYTIKNTGPETLFINGVTAENLNNVSNFTVNTTLPVGMSPGTTNSPNSITLEIEFNFNGLFPSFSFEMDIENNDPDENPYDIFVFGSVAQTTHTECSEAELDNAVSAGGYHIFNCDGPITLTSEKTISKHLILEAASGKNLTIMGAFEKRVFSINSGIHFGVHNLTIANGNSTGDGGGIYNTGTLTVTDSTFSDNSANFNGAGIYNNGTLTVTNSTFSDNSAYTSGGGIYNTGTGTLTVTNSTFSGNGVDGYGGGIYNDGTLMVTNSTFSENGVYDLGGGIYNSGTLTVTDSIFSNNSVVNYGGGIYNSGTLTATNSTFSGNSADKEGGGIYNNGKLTVTNSTFSNNSADLEAGGIENYDTLTVTNSTFSGNSAVFEGGGIENYGTLTVTNSTFSNNSGGYTGGGIMHYNGTLTVTNSTFSGNSADLGGGIYIIYYATMHLKNSILANSTSGNDCYHEINEDSISTVINNLIENNFGCGTPYSTTDPKLGPLASNGGPTQTFALLAGSPAIDAGDGDICASDPVNGLDQRGVTRPQGSCDIGAFEARFGLPWLMLLLE